MSTINYHKREIVAKIVYYGPALGGKTTSLEYIHKTAKGVRGDLISLTTDEDRTLYFDYLPVELPKPGGFTVRVQLYTVPGQVYYNATRKLVLDGADGVVFVADSQPARMAANIESLDNLCENLREKRVTLRGIPRVVAAAHGAAPAKENDPPKEGEELSWAIQYNKRDLPSVIPLATLEDHLNLAGVPSFETVATNGKGILEALQSICMLVLADVRDKGRLREGQARLEAAKALGGKIGVAPMPATEGSMTATSLADITDVVSTLTSTVDDTHEAPVPEELDEEESITRPGVRELARVVDEAAETTKNRHAALAQTHAPAPSHTLELEEHDEEWPTSPGATAMPTTVPRAVQPVVKTGPQVRSSADDIARPGSNGMFSRLVRSSSAREALITIEAHLEKNAWIPAVRAAAEAYRDSSARLSRLRGGTESGDPLTFAALLTGLPASRLVRFRQMMTRISQPDGITADDALFALFFLTDFALRAEELAPGRSS